MPSSFASPDGLLSATNFDSRLPIELHRAREATLCANILGGRATNTALVHTGRSWIARLAWDDARHGAVNPTDGRNLVLHEFAHQLDFEDYATDGAPALATKAEYRSWHE
jgi:hypothetical protein